MLSIVIVYDDHSRMTHQDENDLGSAFTVALNLAIELAECPHLGLQPDLVEVRSEEKLEISIKIAALR